MSSPTTIALLSKAGAHIQKTLKDFRFTFSHKQDKLGWKKAAIGQFDLNPGKKIIQSKTRIPEDVVEKINSILIKQFIPSSKTIVLAQKNASENFTLFAQETFNGLQKKTDASNVCVAGNRYKAELDSMARSGNINLFRMATL
ncbi:hypothetical protein BB560_002133 [Smittium megazygosporum]|uniref:Uncharacterized protein n=1 Tax=Smittium megazygosporum TaxID=133381 RepID=A0A2T9ZFR0_9FUNG|nr:hypothetical protein BB560_002133 [Smittium megazygosporum]